MCCYVGSSILCHRFVCQYFFLNYPSITRFYTYGHTLSLHEALPISLFDSLRVIKEGLTAEDTVIVNGMARVRAGAKVNPKRQDGAPGSSGQIGRAHV